MNCQMSNVNVTYRDGRNSNLELVFIRGSKIRFLILPDMLKNAPMFKRVGQKGAGAGASTRGKVPMMRGQGMHICKKKYLFRFDGLSNINILCLNNIFSNSRARRRRG